MSGSVVLLSGGLDSALCLLVAQEGGEPVFPVFFNYGQGHLVAERERAVGFAARRGLLLQTMVLPTLDKSDDVVFVGRNLLMVATAVPYAASKGCDRIWFGSNWSDRERFPDCRPAFIKSTQAALDAYGVHLVAPLQNMTKAEVVKELRRRGEATADFWSCYQPSGSKPCGECLACQVRAEAGA